jgi:hypothetical protein
MALRSGIRSFWEKRMYVSLKRIAAASVVLLWVGPTIAAEDWAASTDSTASYLDRLEQVEAELAALKMQADSGCAAHSCDSCDSCCEDPPYGPYVGFAFVFARPYFSNNINLESALVDGAGNSMTVAIPFGYAHELTPRVWLGYVGWSGLGLRARYWQFDHDGDPFDAAIPLGFPTQLNAVIGSARGTAEISADAGEALHVVNGLEVHAADFELTQRLDFWQASATVGGGLRYAYLRQAFAAWLDPGVGVLGIRNCFEGLGPTVSIELHRPIGSRGLAVFAGARGSLLFGGADLFTGHFEVVQDLYMHNADTLIGVGEAEIGLEWSRELPIGGSLLLRAGYEGQLWHEAGSPSFKIGDLGFEGFSLALGLSR